MNSPWSSFGEFLVAGAGNWPLKQEDMLVSVMSALFGRRAKQSGNTVDNVPRLF